MSTAQPSRPRARPHGWASFVAVYLLVAGALNAIWGIAALSNKSYFVEGGLLWSQLDTWGWIAIITGVLQFVGCGLVISRHASGAIIAGPSSGSC